MKYIKFENQNNEALYGILENGSVKEISGELFGEHAQTDNEYNLEDIHVLPVCSPSKIVAIGLNYRDHAEEMGKDLPAEPRMFLKPGTAVIGHGDEIVYPDHMSSHVDYEGELAVVIGKKAKDVEESDALSYVFGYTCHNDITARDLQARDIQFTRGKGFDTFAPIGPVIETELDAGNADISTYLNGELKQNSNTSNLIFNIPALVSFISKVMTLLPGDIISTGTPAGVSPMNRGDVVEVKITGIGTLKNHIV